MIVKLRNTFKKSKEAVSFKEKETASLGSIGYIGFFFCPLSDNQNEE